MNETQVKSTLDAWLRKEDPSKETHSFHQPQGRVTNIHYFDSRSGLDRSSHEPSEIESRFSHMVAPA
jgi:hypothetical protein